jgi:hypothetical protein
MVCTTKRPEGPDRTRGGITLCITPPSYLKNYTTPGISNISLAVRKITEPGRPTSVVLCCNFQGSLLGAKQKYTNLVTPLLRGPLMIMHCALLSQTQAGRDICAFQAHGGMLGPLATAIRWLVLDAVPET